MVYIAARETHAANQDMQFIVMVIVASQEWKVNKDRQKSEYPGDSQLTSYGQILRGRSLHSVLLSDIHGPAIAGRAPAPDGAAAGAKTGRIGIGPRAS